MPNSQTFLAVSVYGSSFYGGGGGGSSEEGLALIEAIYKEDPNASIKMIDIQEMENDPNIVSTMIAALGSPIRRHFWRCLQID